MSICYPLCTVAPERSFAISRRAFEICRLLATGKTDRQIAEELGISPRTVSHLLGRVYDKVGVSSRTHVAYLHTRGLLCLAPERVRKVASGDQA